jgi:sarcosine oxidase subunit beta
MSHHVADVVIIGAGIQGLSAAYHLARRGVENVVVLEKAFIGAGSSGRSASMLMLQVWNEWQVRLSQYCFERYMAFEAELGVDPEYAPIGTLLLATAAVADEVRAQAEMRRTLGVTSTQILDAEGITRIAPVINTDDLVLGVYGPEDGIIEAQSIMLGYQKGARRHGADIRQGVAATGIVVENGRVAAVETPDGPIHTGWVVNAAGADAADVARWAGIDLPLDNRARSVYVTGPFPQIPDDTPFVYDEAAGWYYRKEGPGVLIGMGKEKDKPASERVNRDLLPAVIDVAMHRVPVLAEASIASGWTGIRPLTPDGRPILGPVDGVAGYLNDAGWGGEGVMHAPAGGQLIAELICDGETSTFPIEPFLLARFT